MTAHENETMELGKMDGSSRNISVNAFPREYFELDDDGRPQRRGNKWTAASHVITAVIGSGVLSLAWSVGQLGWVAGPLALLFFAVVTYYTSILLADCYRSPDPVTGSRNYSYTEAVRVNLGGKNVFFCSVVQYTNLVGTAIGYTITSSISMVAVQRSNCFHNRGHDARCYASNNPYMVAFGICQIIFSQIPNFGEIWWLSIVAAVMSLFYASAGLGLGISKAIDGDYSHGSVGGIPVGTGNGDVSTAQKTWYMFQALGNISFAYSFSMILVEIQDTIRGPPKYMPENKTMKQATLYGIIVTTFCYMSVGSAGYLAFGNDVPGNILTGFGFYSPFWLVDLANIAIVVHLVGAYQVYSQPLFGFVEGKAREIWPNSDLIHRDIKVKFAFFKELPFNWFRLMWRSSFVILVTLVAMLLPFFNSVVGLIGAFAFWPLTVYFPVAMYVKARGIRKWTRKWTVLQLLSVICLFVSVAAGIGSIAGIIQALKDYKPFHTTYSKSGQA